MLDKLIKYRIKEKWKEGKQQTNKAKWDENCDKMKMGKRQDHDNIFGELSANPQCKVLH